MAFELPALQYPFAALEPHIDARTMEIHHDKHHAAYTTNLNNAINGTAWEGKSIEEILTDLANLPDDKRNVVRNNGGGFANHNLFWEVIGPDAGGEPTGELADAINAAFGSYADFKTKFENAAKTQFGSGWAWLYVTKAGALAVKSTPNQDTPLMDGETPILGLDVWEHAYYLNYQNRRPDYVAAFWNVVNWNVVAQKFAAAKS
ncbi:MAG: superoxide dismutase [Phototrophicaceae bacterium]|jgi:Fe-Mn family superoxide dismutase